MVHAFLALAQTGTLVTFTSLLGYGKVHLWLRSEAEGPDSWVKLEGNPHSRRPDGTSPISVG